MVHRMVSGADAPAGDGKSTIAPSSGGLMHWMRAPRLVVPAVLAALYVGSVASSERSARAMADAATRFVAALTPDERAQATFAFESDERTHWHFIPTEAFPRHGLQ